MNFKSTGLLLSALMVIGSSVVHAEFLTVLSDNPNAKIYLNGEFIGDRSVANYSITPGEYQVKVTDTSGIIYSKLVTIEKDKNKTVVADRFIAEETNISDRSSRLSEGDRIHKAKGTYGIGVELGVIPGVNLHYSIDTHWGVDMTGYIFKSNGNNQSGIEGRLNYSLVNTVVNSAPASLYLSAGLGRSDSNSDNNTMASVSIGLEFSTRSAVSHPDGIYIGNGIDYMTRSLFSIENMYAKTEIGIGQINSTTTGEYLGLVGRVGLSLFF